MAAALVNVPGAGHVGMTLVEGRTWSTPAVTDPLVGRIDALQYEVGEGPCVEASRNQVITRSDDLRVDPRWPRFSRRAAELGVMSMFSVQLFVAADSFGSLNFYAKRPSAFDAEAERSAMLFASHAALAIRTSRRDDQFRVALDHRDVIGQAKGILMERHWLTAEQAFAVLATTSQHQTAICSTSLKN